MDEINMLIFTIGMFSGVIIGIAFQSMANRNYERELTNKINELEENLVSCKSSCSSWATRAINAENLAAENLNELIQEMINKNITE